MFFRTSVFVLFLAAFFCTAGLADTAVPWVGWIIPANTQEASLLVLPDGSGPPLTEAMLFGGQPVDASIVVGVTDEGGYPIVNFPWEDIWLDPESETVFMCNIPYPWGFASDSSTDTNGETTFATSLAGGGYTEDPIYVYLNGSRAMSPDFVYFPPVPLRINSPDINADGDVNLIDVSGFAEDYFGAYHYRSDFRWDGVNNLSDLGKMTAGYGTSCD